MSFNTVFGWRKVERTSALGGRGYVPRWTSGGKSVFMIDAPPSA